MEFKICACCGQSFPPDPRVKNQTYCSSPACQADRRKHWRQTRSRTDEVYLDNKSRAQRAWLDRNPDYWRTYRANGAGGRALGRGTQRVAVDITASSLVRTYQKEVERQKLMVKKAGAAQQRLLFVIGALGQLLANEHFTTLLRAEGLDTLPTYLAERVWPKGA